MSTVKELQQILRSRGMKISGKKDELIARLVSQDVNKCGGKTCPAGKICNPASGRCVSAGGKIGQVLKTSAPSPPKLQKITASHKTMAKLLYMEKLYEEVNKRVPSAVKLTRLLQKWKQNVITPNLNAVIKYKAPYIKWVKEGHRELFVLKKIIKEGFTGKPDIFTEEQLFTAFVTLFKTDLKKNTKTDLTI